MKKNILRTLLAVAIAFVPVAASAQCPTPTATGIQMDGHHCFVKGVWTGQQWAFRNYEEFTVAGVGTVEIDSIRVDSITNLPCGIQWTTSNVARDHRFTKLEEGCFSFAGVTNDAVGQYNPTLWLTAWLGGSTDTAGTQVDSRLGGIRIFATVIDTNGTCPAINRDTTFINMVSSCSFTGSIDGNQTIGIKDLGSVSRFSNSPNPFSSTTVISFTASEANNYAFKVYDVTGKLVHSNDVKITTGNNTIIFDRKGLGAGVYFYSITDGKNMISNKMVITQ